MKAPFRFTGRRLGRTAAVLSIGLVGAATVGTTSAFAQTELALQPSHVGATASGFPTQDDDCGNAANEDGWHFVAPANATFLELTVTFELPGGDDLSVTFNEPGDFGPPDASHAFVITPAGATLTGGTAVVEETDLQQDFFVLSHTCPGTPGNGETTPPGNGDTTPPEEETPPGEDDTTPAGEELPKTGTGFPVVPFMLLAVLLIGAGTGMLMRVGAVPMPYRRRH